MKPSTTLAALLVGTAVGAGLVVACSDDAPREADAAVCDCPAAEPPLPGRIISIVGVPVEFGAGASGLVGSGCPSGAIILGGGCSLGLFDDPDVHLIYAGFDRRVPTQPGYICSWASTSTMTRTGIAEAICLVPPSP